jgi:Na+-transporting methylmalonyl-CoA/oxaloacetate decarboxylase gamma subunit
VSWISNWWQQVSGTVTQGLQITTLGMTLVFLTLGLIILVLTLLTRLPGLRTRQEMQVRSETRDQSPKARTQPTLSEETEERATAVSRASDDAELAQVAAIAVALLRSQRVTRSRPKTRPITGRWKQYGRAHQLGL